jgi:hypothetical protein
MRTIPGTRWHNIVQRGCGRMRKESLPHTLVPGIGYNEMSQTEREVTEKQQVT